MLCYRFGGSCRRPSGNINVPIDSKEPGNRRVVETKKHHLRVATLLDDVPDRAPLKTAPLLIDVVGTEKHNNQIGIVVIDALQKQIEVGAR